MGSPSLISLINCGRKATEKKKRADPEASKCLICSSRQSAFRCPALWHHGTLTHPHSSIATSRSVPLPSCARPDITVMLGWALKTNYLSDLLWSCAPDCLVQHSTTCTHHTREFHSMPLWSSDSLSVTAQHNQYTTSCQC